MSDTPRTRLYVPAPLARGATVDLTDAQHHYLRHVLRHHPGDDLLLFNGTDGEWRGRIAALSREGGRIMLEDKTREQTGSPDLWLLFAPLKRDGTDLIAEKGTELGVRRFVPVFTHHTDVTRINLERFQANTLEAAQQCGRLDVPEVSPPRSLEEILTSWEALSSASSLPVRPLLVCAETGPAEPFSSLQNSGAPDTPSALLVGPEGGFAPHELDRLRHAPFTRFLRLGPRILRAETAALAALACWQALAGDWRS